MIYAFTENFLLPCSHDEVVHGKESMINKMPGDEWQRFANLRALYTYLFTHPGKKLLFMGTEFGQGNEWDATRILEWHQLDYPFHQGVQQLVKDLNRTYTNERPLYHTAFSNEGFEWIDCNDAQNWVLIYQSKDDDGNVLVVALNLTPVPREDYRIGVPKRSKYREIFNSDAAVYGGATWAMEPSSL